MKYKRGQVCQTACSLTVDGSGNIVVVPRGLTQLGPIQNEDVGNNQSHGDLELGSAVTVVGNAADFQLHNLIAEHYTPWLSHYDRLVVVLSHFGEIGWCHEDELESMGENVQELPDDGTPIP